MGRSSLEVFKFSVYIAVPAVLTAAVAFNTDALNAIIKRHAYVQYPPEGPRPPPPDELRALAKKNGAASK